jgi:branched-chain amino acid transport system substrate-binding protein
MDTLAKETGKAVKKIALFYEGGDWGRSHAANIRKMVPEHGIQIVFDEPAPPNQVDFTSQLLKIRAAKPDALILALYTPDQLLFTRQLAEQRLDLPFGVHSDGGGTVDPSFYAAIPPKSAAYYFVQQIEILDKNKDPRLVEIDKRTQDKFGFGASLYGAQGVSVAYVIADALERAKSADRQKLRDALAATDITDGLALFPGWLRIKFDENGQNTYAYGVITENLDGERRTVWPSEKRLPGTKLVWPIPAWSERK